MNSHLKVLLDAELVSVTFIHDYFQIGFSNGAGLTINNKFDCSTQDYRSLIGLKIKEIEENKDYIAFHFSNGERLSVGFKTDDFLCPEAMLLYTEGSVLPMIWDENSGTGISE